MTPGDFIVYWMYISTESLYYFIVFLIFATIFSNIKQKIDHLLFCCYLNIISLISYIWTL